MHNPNNKYLKKQLFITIIILIVVFIAEFFLSLFMSGTTDNTTEQMYYWGQIISSLFVIGGVIIAIWQYTLSIKDSKNNLALIQVQRAIDLSGYFKNNILKYYPAIHYIFLKSGILEILDSINPENIKDFDFQELNNVFTKKQIEDLKKIQDSEKFYAAILEANEIYTLNLHIMRHIRIGEKDNKKHNIINTSSVIVSFAANLVSDMLNNMEYFALHFKHNTADESVVYQSLHQAYLEITFYMYYYIANTNKNSSDKYYTNLIGLYHDWYNKKQQQYKECSQKLESIPSHGTVINKF